MGLNDSTHEKRTYLNIVNGKFAKRVPEGTAGAVAREIEYPKGTKRTIYETLHGSIDAIIEGIEIKDTDFGEQINIHMGDVADKFTISLGLGSREGKGFMQCLPNINIRQQVTFEPYNYARKSDNKQMIGMGIKYTGDKENIKFFYDEKSGMPSGGDEKMDKDEFKLLMAQQTIFLKKATKKIIDEWFGAGGTGEAAPTRTQQVVNQEIKDDLPFFLTPNYFNNLR